MNAGEQIGPYLIEAAIGEGGMGAVYRARDTRLDRTVALKVSKADFSDRFEREAKIKRRCRAFFFFFSRMFRLQPC